jgi:hypothetical protein
MIKIRPNIGIAIRITYLILGLAFVLTPFVVKLPLATTILLPVAGVATMASGAFGF